MTTRSYDNLVLANELSLTNYNKIVIAKVATTCMGSIRGRYNPTLTNVSANNTPTWSTGSFSSMVLATSDVFMVDGVSLSNGDDILIKDEYIYDDTNSVYTSERNGIYTITISGTSLSMTRATSFDTVTEYVSGDKINILFGDVNGGKSFILQATPTTINVSNMDFKEGFTKQSNIVQLNSNSGLIIARRKDDQVVTWGDGSSLTDIQFGRGTAGTALTPEVIPKKQPGIGPIGIIRKLGNTFKNIIILDENNNLFTEGKNITQFMGNNKTADTYYDWHLVSTDVLDFKVSEVDGNVDNYRLFIKKTDNYWYATGSNDSTYGSCAVNSTSSTISALTKIKHDDGSDVGTDVRDLFVIGSLNGTVVIQKTNDSIWVAGGNASGELGMANTTAYTGFVDNTAEWVTNRSLTSGYTKIMDCQGSSYYHDIAGTVNGKIMMLIGNGTIGTILACGNQYLGSLGNGEISAGNVTTPVTVTIGSESNNIIKFRVAPMTNLFISDTYTGYVVGYNAGGQLGDGTTTSNGTPSNSYMPTNAKIVDGWMLHSHYANNYRCSVLLKTDFGLYISGHNLYKEAGDGTAVDLTSFALISNEDIIDAMAVSYGSAEGKTILLLTTNGRIMVSGRNNYIKTVLSDPNYDYPTFTELNHPAFSC